MTPTIVCFDSIDSTNLEAIRQAKAGASEGLCIVAREQTQGRGRLDRTWQSPKDAGVYVSVVLRPKLPLPEWPLIGLAAALSVSDAVWRMCHVKVDIKWPNDICVNDRKLCGILAETVETKDGAAAIVGIGINVKHESFPADIGATATSLELLTRAAVEHQMLLDQVLKAIGERYDMLQSEGGCEHTIREWCASSSYAFDRRVRVSLGDESFVGVTRGLESDGALRIETAEGAIQSVRAGDVTALRPYISR